MGASQSHPARENHDPSVATARPSQDTLPTTNPPLKGDSHLPPRLSKNRPGPASSDLLQSPIAFPHPDVSYILPTLKFGAYTGATGLFLGSFYGILRSSRPVSFSIAAGIQWGLAGASFHGVRSYALYSLAPPSYNESSRSDGSRPRLVADVLASAAAGGVMASASGGMKSISPGAFIFGMVGLGGHWINEKRLERLEQQADQEQEIDQEQDKKNMGWIEWATTRKYSPLRMLSDKEYKEILLSRLAKVEAEIAVLEDDIEEIREKAKEKNT